MMLPTATQNTQPDVMAEDNITDIFDVLSALSCQKGWHTPMAFLPPSIPHIHTAVSVAVTKAGKLLDGKAKNWPSWSQSMGLLFNLFNIQHYVSGEITCPDPDDDPEGICNWKFNDTYAQVLITSNISDAEKTHT